MTAAHFEVGEIVRNLDTGKLSLITATTNPWSFAALLATHLPGFGRLTEVTGAVLSFEYEHVGWIWERDLVDGPLPTRFVVVWTKGYKAYTITCSDIRTAVADRDCILEHWLADGCWIEGLSRYREKKLLQET